jgi:Uncharacterized protein conserved in bacteria
MRHRFRAATPYTAVVLAGFSWVAAAVPPTLAAGVISHLQAPEPPAADPQVKALIDQGDQYFRAGRMEEAVRAYQRAVEQAHALKDLVGEGAALNNLGAALSQQGQRERALEAYEKSLTVKKASNDLTGAAQTLNNLGNIFAESGEAERAVNYYQQSLKIKEQTGDRPGQATTLLNIGTVYKQTGDQKKALDTYARARDLFRAEKDIAGEGSVLNNIGNLYAETGAPATAIQYYEESLALKRKAGDTAGQAKTLANLGAVYAAGQPAEAVKRYNEALTLLEKAGDKHAAAAIHHNLGGFYAATGQLDQAGAELKRAADAYREAKDVAGEGIALQGLGALALRRGDLPGAQRAFSQAIDILRPVGDRRGLAAALQGLAAVEAETAQLRPALEHYTEAAKYAREVQDSPTLAGILAGMGAAYTTAGDSAKALEAYQESYRLRAEHGDRSGAARVLTSVGLVYEGAGQFADARKAYESAISLSEKVRQDLSRLSVETRAAFLAANLDAYQGLVRTHLKQNNSEAAFAAAQQTKARLLNDLMAGGGVELRGRLSESDLKKERTLRARADALNTAMIAEGVRNEVGSKKRFEAYRKELQEVERDLAAFLDGAYAKHPDLAAKRAARTATLADVAAALPEDTALLEYVVLPQPQRGSGGTGPREVTSDTVLFVVTRAGGRARCTAYSLKINAARLAAQAEAFRKVCADPKATWKDEARALHDLLLAPATADLTGKKRLIVCPDGPLWDIPFGAMITESGETLLQQYEIDMGFSATGVRAAMAARQTPKAPGAMFVLANPDFGGAERFRDSGRPISAPDRPIGSPDRPIGSPDRPIGAPDRILTAADRIIGAADRTLVSPDRVIASPDRLLGTPDRVIGAPDRAIVAPDRLIGAPDRDTPIKSGGKLVPLPGTQKEAEAVRGTFPGAKIVTGKDAQEAAVKSEAGKHRMLHLATHGFFNDGSPLSSCIVLSQPRDKDNDGYLTAREVFDLDLSAVEMTVLSACNTGRGQKQRGEGVVGLTWALFAAGCPTQVLSQWAVNDASTALLMERFYKRLAAGEAKGDALRNAALSLSAEPDTAHPYYWAPFVLYGDWR